VAASATAAPSPTRPAPGQLATSTSPAATSAPAANGISRPEVVVQGLDVPWALVITPDGRWLVTERTGKIRVVSGGKLQPDPWATLPVSAQSGSELGLLGLALDPSFASNHFVYVFYTYSDSGKLWNRLVRMVDDGGRGRVDRTLIDHIGGAGIHDGGRVKFGPDGKLYVTTGEAGQGTPAQDLASLNGKILRLNSDGTVPADNPFPGSYVYSFGHRNPEGLAWQPDTGRLFVSEHGPSGAPPNCCHDEINLIAPGVNYGWPIVWGVANNPKYRDPVAESGDDTWAPSGAVFVTQGSLRGTLLVAALRGQAVRVFHFSALNGAEVISQEAWFSNQFGRLRDVELGPDGAYYILTSNRDGRGQPGEGDDKILRSTLP